MRFDPQTDMTTPGLWEAVSELEAVIRAAYPAAHFSHHWLDDPEGMHIRVMVPVDDPETVFDLVCDRLLHFQIEDGLPLYIVPVRPVGEVIKQLHNESSTQRPPQAPA